jgi:hypothetical protein
MRLPRILVIALAALAFTASLAFGNNSLLYWNDQVLNATRLSRNPPPLAALHIATYHAAIFDAVNGISRTHQNWLVQESAPADANIDAAVAGAGFTVLNALWGQSSNPRNFQIALDQALAAIPDGPAKAAGLAWGKHVADLVLARRAQSGYDKPIPGQYTSTEPGKWRETPPGFRPPVMPHIAKVVPFALTSPEQFRAPPPQKIDSKEYAEEIAFVARVGPRDGADRTEYQTLSTPFWADDLGTATPAGHWNVVAQDLAKRNHLDTITCARLFALLNFACADAGISCWDSKFFYSTWRPETAIRESDRKSNPLIINNPDFIPNMAAPAHPDYTSGHSTFTGAATRLLERWFGKDEIEFTTTSDGLPGAVRTFKTLSEARREVGMSRIYGGIHTMSANLEGQKAGIKVADWVFENSLQPAKPASQP